MKTSQDPFGTTPRLRRNKKLEQADKPALCLTIISHPDLERVGDRFFQEKTGETILLSRNEPDFIRPGRKFGKPLNDPFISRTPLKLTEEVSGAVVLHRAGSQTVVHSGERPLGAAAQFKREYLQLGVPLTLAERVVILLHLALPEQISPKEDHGILGFNDQVQLLRLEIDRVANLRVPILLRGPSGTGKELVAAAIHARGRPKAPFVSVNLAAIPPDLATSELFGAEKGSFTGADRAQLGLFRRADGGTLFLDEIGEAPVQLQVALLRALETGEIMPVGAQRAIPVKLQLIAATDANLETLMEQDSFKKALFHRLSAYEIYLPSLCERLDDLGYLFIHFARQELAETGELHCLKPKDPFADPWIPASLMVRLLRYHWPGNIRQLRNMARQIIIANRGKTRLNLPPRLADTLARVPETHRLTDEARHGVHCKPAELTIEEIAEVMRANRWDIKASAQMLGIARGSLYTRIKNSAQLCTAADLTRNQIEDSLRLHKGDLDAMVDALRVSGPALKRRAGELGLDLDNNLH